MSKNDVKWIKITTDIFDNLKIKHLKAVPELGHALVCVWFELLCMAGTCNKCGMLSMSNNLAITEDLIAEAFHEDIKLVQMALRMFQEMGMIEITDNNSIQIANWLEYQSEEGLEAIRKYERENKAKYREKQKQIALEDKKCPRTMSKDKSVDSSISISTSNSSLSNNSISNKETISNIVNYLNKVLGSNYKSTSKNTVKHINARLEEGYLEEEFFAVIDKMYEKWHGDSKMAQYLRPETLFGTKFESYLNMPVVNQTYSSGKRDLLAELMEV